MAVGNRRSVVASIGLPGGAIRVAVGNGIAYIAGGYRGLWVFNLRDPANPSAKALAEPTGGKQVAVAFIRGFTIVLNDRHGLQEYDV